MSYPPGIILRPVTIGGATVLESGEQLSLVAQIKSSRGLMWGATGWQFHALPRTIKGADGEELTFSLPVTDLAGWRLLDNPGSAIDVTTPGSYTHTYTVKLTTLQGGRAVAERTVGPFVLPAEDLSPVDLDLMLPAPTVAGGVVQVPGTWDARVAAAEAAAVAVATTLTSEDAAVASFVDSGASATRAALGRLASAGSALADCVGKVRAGVADVHILLIGDSVTAATSGWSGMLPSALAEMFPTHTVTKRYWEDGTPGAWGVATTVSTGSGARTIAVHVAAVAGKTWQYHLDVTRRAAMLGVSADAVLIYLGHNEDNGTGGMNAGAARLERGKVIASIGEIQQVAASGGYGGSDQTYVGTPSVVLMSTNPLQSTPFASEFRADMYRRIARQLGLGFIDVNRAFRDDGRTIHTDLVSDGAHPSIAGHEIIAGLVAQAFRQADGARPLPEPVPWMHTTAMNLLPDGGLTNLDGSNKPPAWTLVNCSATVDTVDFESGTKSLVLTVSATGATPYVAINLPPHVKGRVVTLAVRLKTMAGKFSTPGVGGIGFYDGATNPTQNSWAQHDQWTWRVFSYRFSASATATTARVYIGNNASPTTDQIKLDRAVCVLGPLPAELGDTPA